MWDPQREPVRNHTIIHIGTQYIQLEQKSKRSNILTQQNIKMNITETSEANSTANQTLVLTFYERIMQYGFFTSLSINILLRSGYVVIFSHTPSLSLLCNTVLFKNV